MLRGPRRRPRRRRARSPDRATRAAPRRARRQPLNSATVRSSTPAARPRHPACAMPTARASAVREDDGQAVGSQHRADDPVLARYRGVGDCRSRRALRDMDRDVGAVNLMHPARRRRAERQQPAAILGDRIVRVANACAKIERGARTRAYAAAARRDERVHAGRNRPVGHDPVEPRGGDPSGERKWRRRGHAEAGPARRVASSAAKSAGSGECHSHALPVSG